MVIDLDPVVLVTIRDLPDCCQPGFVNRVGPLVVVTFHIYATMLQASLLCIDQLYEAELNTVRAGFGEPPVGQPSDPFWLRDDVHVSLELVPDALLTSKALRRKQAEQQTVLGA